MLAPRHNAIDPGIRDKLAARLDGLDLTSGPALLRVDLDVSLRPWAWLRRQHTSHRVYWRSRSGDLEVAGVGVAYAEDGRRGPGLRPALERVRRHLDTALGDINCYGGMAFDLSRPLKAPWQCFSPFYFVVPRLEVRCQQGRTTCALNLKLPEDNPILGDLLDDAGAGFSVSQQASASLPADMGIGAVMSRLICPDQRHWTDQVNTVLGVLRQTQAKLVLACQERICFQEPVDPLEVLNRIRSDRSDSYGFMFSFGQAAFLGMSPEQLYERQGRHLRTEALAGTGETGAALQTSVKENTEQDYVVRDIQEALSAVGLDMNALPPKEIVHWNRLRHLRTKISGRLPSDIGDGHLLNALHPSAAVLGYPRDLARAWLQQYEPMERGWYAGPVGRIGRDSAEFAVASRSALVQGKTLDIYAGAGIVRGSDPESEWHEIKSKMRQFHEALGVRP